MRLRGALAAPDRSAPSPAPADAYCNRKVTLMRPKLLIVAAAVALLFAPSALAKGPFQICGADACAQLAPETTPPVRVFGLPASTPRVAPPAPAPYYVIRF